MVQSHDGAVRSVMERGDALLASVHYPSIRDKMSRLQRDYSELCKTATVSPSDGEATFQKYILLG